MMNALKLIVRRTLAYFVDIFLLFIVLAPLAFLFEYLLNIRPQTNSQVWAAAIISFSIPAWSYFVLSDMSQGGATIGKRIMQIRVFSSDNEVGLPPRQALARTALKLLPWELAHIFGFALAGLLGSRIQSAGLIVSNFLLVLYFSVMVGKSGRKSVHDLLVGSEVRLAESSDLVEAA